MGTFGSTSAVRVATCLLAIVAALLFVAGAMADDGATPIADEEVGSAGNLPPVAISVVAQDFQNVAGTCVRFGPEGAAGVETCVDGSGYAPFPIPGPGRYVLEVTTVPAGCAVVSENPRLIEITADDIGNGLLQYRVILGCEGDQPDDNLVFVSAYVCQDAARAGEVAFVVGSGNIFEAADDPACRLAAAGEQTFRLVPVGGQEPREAATDATGSVRFEAVAAGSYAVTELASGTMTERFEFSPFPPDGSTDVVSVTAITYVAEAPLPPPDGTGNGSVEVILYRCDGTEAQDGTYDVFVGAAVFAAGDEPSCSATSFFNVTISGEALPAPRTIFGEGSFLLVANDLPPGEYVVHTDPDGATSPPFALPAGGLVRVTFVVYTARRSQESLTVQKFFCADPNRAGSVDFLLGGGFGLIDFVDVPDAEDGASDESAAAGPDAAGVEAPPACRLAGVNEVAFVLTRSSDGEVFTQRTVLGGGQALFQVLVPGEYTLTEAGSGAASDPFEIGDVDAVTVVNWVEMVDQTPGAGSDDDSGVSLHSLVCIDPARAGETDFLIGADPSGGPGGFAAPESWECGAGVGDVFEIAPAGGGQAIILATGTCGCSFALLAPGSYVLTVRATGETVGPFEVAANAPTQITVVRWATEIEPRVLVILRKTTCPVGTADPFAVCGRNVLPGIGFTAAGDSATTDDRGIAFLGVPAGEVTIQEDPAVLAAYDGAAVHCRAYRFDEPPIGDRVLFDGRADGGAVQITVDEGDEVECDWYNLTGAGVSPTPTRTATPMATPKPTPTAGATSGVTTLPSTGVEARAASRAFEAVLFAIAVTLTAAAGLTCVHRRR